MDRELLRPADDEGHRDVVIVICEPTGRANARSMIFLAMTGE
jgi:hypothetical protein